MTEQPTCDCAEAVAVLYEYLDGELTAERRQLILGHLDECGPCLSAFSFEQELKDAIARCGHDQVPADLLRRVAQALDDSSS